MTEEGVFLAHSEVCQLWLLPAGKITEEAPFLACNEVCQLAHATCSVLNDYTFLSPISHTSVSINKVFWTR